MTDSQREPIGGRYQVLTTLGRGGMGVVYKAHDPVLERDVAIKQMATSLVDSEEHRRRFQIEARAAARLNHPNIVTIYELEEHDGDVFIIMELLEGLPLGTLQRRGVRLPLPAQLAILAQVCDGLDFAHSRAIVHRDIKPANLVLLPSGVVKILDFGIAQLAASDLTKQGALLGTPNYMAPEQVRGEAVDSRADLFSVGAVAYELVSGVKAFSADSVPALLLKIAEATHQPLAETAPQVPAALAAVIDRLLSKNRDDRFARGADVRTALEAIGPIDRLDLIADAVTLAMSPSEGDTLVQFALPERLPADRSVTPVASRSSVSAHRAGTTPPPGTPPAITPPPTPSGASSPSQVSPAAATPSVDALALAVTQNLGPSELPAPAAPVSGAIMPPPLPAGVMPTLPAVPPLPDAGLPASTSAAGSPVAPSSAAPGTAPHAAATAASSGEAAPPALAGAPAQTAPPAATAPSPTSPASSASSAQPPSSPQLGAAVPAARRAGRGTAILVLGLAAALFGIFVGASYMWWQRLRAEIKPRVTTESSAAVTADHASAARSAATPSQEPSSAPAASQASAPEAAASEAPSPDRPSSDASSSRTPASDAPSSSATVDAPSNGAAPSETASPIEKAQPVENVSSAEQATANASPSTLSPASRSVTSATDSTPSNAGARTSTGGSTPSVAVRQPAAGAGAVNATAPRDATSVSAPRTFRDPEPPVDPTQPPPPADPDDQPAPTGAPSASARATRSGPPPRTAVDAETVSAFRRSGDASALVGSDQTMIAAATVRVRDTIERYGKALQERDAEALRALRDAVTPSEQRLLDGAGATVRFSDIDVEVEAPTQATAHARRIITPAGRPPVSESITFRLIRKPAGWVITSVSR